MSRRTLGIIFIIAGLALIGAVVFFMIKGKTDNAGPAAPAKSGRGSLPDSTGSGKANPQDSPGANIDFTEEEIAPEKIAQSTAARIAASFAERFGSFSNQSGYENMSDLELVMTDSMKTWVRQYSESSKKAAGLEEYSGMTTKALNTSIKSEEEGKKLVVTVKTKRMETSAKSKEPKTYLQDMDVTMVMPAKEWKVDKAEWKPVE